MLHSAPLVETAAALRSGQLDLFTYLNELCDCIDTYEPQIQALLPEPDRRERLLAEAQKLQERYPHPADRPPLYGIPVGIKDMFFVDGFPTRVGSQLPPELFTGEEGDYLKELRRAGVLILGKTVTTEFAYFEPGPTRNPHNLDYSPGGSSSGSAAAVAAGFCPLAIGTQVIGSTVLGIFTQDVEGMALVASLLCENWQPARSSVSDVLPVLGVPEGPYLAQASPEALIAFEQQLVLLQKAGYTVRRVQALLHDIEAINRRHSRIIFAHMAQVHAPWFEQYSSLYRPRTLAAVREGQEVSAQELAELLPGRLALHNELEMLMTQAGIDLWVCPPTTGPAPQGYASTGSPLMNLPWTHSGMPLHG